MKVLTSTLQFVTDKFVALDKWVSGILGYGQKDKEGNPTQTGTGALSALTAGALTAFAGYKVYKGIRNRSAVGTEAPGAWGTTEQKALYVKVVGAGLAGAGAAGGGSPLPGTGGGPGAKGAGGGGRVGRMLGGAGRLLGKAFLPLSLAMGAFDAFQGFGADPSAGFGSKLLNAGSSALSGASFGLLGSSPEEIAARANAPGAPQAQGQMSMLEQIDQMLESRPGGINLQYTETGQALRDFSLGYREAISALDLTPAGGLDAARGLLNLVNAPRQSAITPPDYQAAASDWQTEVMITWKTIKEINENMVSLLIRIASNTDSLGDGIPVQGSGMQPG